MARVHLQNRIHQIRGGGVAYSWTTKVFYQAKVFAPEVVLLGCCDGAAAAAEAWQLAAADGGGSLRWRQFDNPEGKSSQSARMFDAKRNTKALWWWWPLCLLLVSHCTGYEQSGKQEGQKNERRAKKIDLCGRSIVWRPSRVRLQLSACSACLFGPELFLALLGGTRLFEKPWGGLFANCCFVLYFPVMTMAKQEGQKKKEEKNM